MQRLEIPEKLWVRLDFNCETGEVGVTGEIPDSLTELAETLGSMAMIGMSAWVKELKYVNMQLDYLNGDEEE